MIGIYLGIIIFFTGVIMTVFINRNAEVPMSGDFWDMPIKIKFGIISIILGILLFCASIIFMLIINPVEFLRYLN